MLPQKKEAWIELCGSILFSIPMFILMSRFDSYRLEVIFLALIVFIAAIWIGRRSIGLKIKALDERDMLIRYQAGMIAFHGFGIIIMIGAIVLCLYNRTTLTIPALHVALLVYWSYMAMYFFSSISVLILYRKAV